MQNLPETVQKAAVLQESLTPEQHAAVREVLDRYQPEMQAIMEVFTALPKSPAGAEPQPLDKDITARMTAMLYNIDAEMATFLNADQLALYRAVMQPPFDGEALPNTSKPEGAPAVPQGSYTDNCFYGAYYTAYTSYYGYFAYIYGYYDYYYGYPYGYEAYIYSYYGFVYGDTALDYSAPTYVQGYYFGMWTCDYPYYAWLYSYYAETYTYYGYIYAFYDYYYYGSTYGYYSYVYGVYANGGADIAEYYTYYCYYYTSQ
jgi:hypothetical protein